MELTALILSPYSTASSSIKGAIMRHGPHHGAQKSTMTGTELSKTSSFQFPSFTAGAARTGIIRVAHLISLIGMHIT